MTAPDDPEHARFAELNALAGVLPYHRRDELSALLSDADVATLRHLVESGMGANTLRAIASDLAYLERWALAATGSPLPWAPPTLLVVKFIAHHLWDAVKKQSDPEHGMPDEVASALRALGALKSTGPYAPGTVKLRIRSGARCTNGAGCPALSATARSGRRSGCQCVQRPGPASARARKPSPATSWPS
jgi:hypothetical protein